VLPKFISEDLRPSQHNESLTPLAVGNGKDLRQIKTNNTDLLVTSVAMLHAAQAHA